MLFKVGNEIIDTDVTPVALIFKDKEEAKTVTNILANIKNGDTAYPISGNGKWWFMTPAGWTKEECDKWSTLNDEEKVLLENRNKISDKLTFEL